MTKDELKDLAQKIFVARRGVENRGDFTVDAEYSIIEALYFLKQFEGKQWNEGTFKEQPERTIDTGFIEDIIKRFNDSNNKNIEK